jgi:microcystin-dependent protein
LEFKPSISRLITPENSPKKVPMSEPFLSEIKLMSFNFPPKGWAMCNGQLLPINQNQALFSLLGTTYGGDGRVNFGLPNLQGRTPIHVGNGHVLGEIGGEQAHTLSISELPTHTHTASAANVPATSNAPSNARMISQSTGANLYAGASNLQAMAPQAIASVGGSQAHPNMQPYLTLTFCIALQGIFPTQN